MPLRITRYARSPLGVLRFLYHLPRLGVLIHRLITDPRVPFYTKLLPLAALIYVVMPIDILPEIRLLGLGYMDDVLVVYFLLKTFLASCPSEIVEEHVRRLSSPKKKTPERE